MNRYPTGNSILCRYYFAQRTLTDPERERFFAGEGLPNGVGYDPASVKFIYEIPQNSTAVTLEGAAVIRDAIGAYHSVLTPTDEQDGTWRYKGRGYNSEGVSIVTTQDRLFAAVP